MKKRKPPSTLHRSLQTELPTFIIPTGTQVVLKTSKRVPHTTVVKPAGSVAEVRLSPASNRLAYVLRFADGAELRAKFPELAIRRREVDAELERPQDALQTPGEDLRQYVIYRCSVGSRAFGLATEDSDEDIRGIYLPPASMTWSLWKPPPADWPDRSEPGRVDWTLPTPLHRRADRGEALGREGQRCAPGLGFPRRTAHRVGAGARASLRGQPASRGDGFPACARLPGRGAPAVREALMATGRGAACLQAPLLVQSLMVLPDTRSGRGLARQRAFQASG